MPNSEPAWDDPHQGQAFSDLEEDEFLGDWDPSQGLEFRPARDDLWEVFECDGGVAEPEPEYGDFWGVLDEEETI